MIDLAAERIKLDASFERALKRVATEQKRIAAGERDYPTYTRRVDAAYRAARFHSDSATATVRVDDLHRGITAAMEEGSIARTMALAAATKLAQQELRDWNRRNALPR